MHGLEWLVANVRQVGMARVYGRKKARERGPVGAVLRVMFVACAFGGINMQIGAIILPSGMNRLEKK